MDSLGKARNTDPSDGDATIKLTNSIESLGIPVLAIDHVTKADNRDIKNGKVQNPNAVFAIGSQFSTAGARLAWFFQEMSDSSPGYQRLNIHNTKHNHVAEQESRSLRIELRSDDFHALDTVTFQVHDSMIFEEFQAESTEMILLKWMMNNSVKTTTATEISKSTGLERTAAARAFKNHEWFDPVTKVGKSQPYQVSSEGRVQYTRLTQGDDT